jgi:copper(I)-binding protein
MPTDFIRRLMCGVALMLASLAASAHSYKIGPIGIDHPWARPTVTGQPVGGAYMKIANKGAADRLLSATTAVAAAVQMHTMAMDGDVMTMREVDAVDLPAGQTVEFKPGGFHLMLMGLKAPLKSGDKFAVTLRFEKAGEVVVTVRVESVAATSGAAAPGGQHSH